MEENQSNTTAPRDGEGCEAVTVVIIARNGQRGALAARSVRQNLLGVDADIQVLTGSALKPTDAETLLEYLPHVETERIILMTDGMIILNPVTIYEIGCRRGELTAKGITAGECRTPKLMHRSVLEKMLPAMIRNFAAFDILLEYDQYARPSVAPVAMRPWNEDNWLLPVVSKKPSAKALAEWGKTQHFALIYDHAWTEDVVRFLEERFPA